MEDSATISVIKLTCLHCGHTWIPRTDRVPVVCPHCKRYGWNVPPTGESAKKHKNEGGAHDVKTSKRASRKRTRKPSAIDKYKERMNATQQPEI